MRRDIAIVAIAGAVAVAPAVAVRSYLGVGRWVELDHRALQDLGIAASECWIWIMTLWTFLGIAFVWRCRR